MTEPFVDPPQLSDDFEARTRQRATHLRHRRRAGVVAVAAALLVVVGVAIAATGSGRHPDAQLHVTGSTTPGSRIEVGHGPTSSVDRSSTSTTKRRSSANDRVVPAVPGGAPVTAGTTGRHSAGGNGRGTSPGSDGPSGSPSSSSGGSSTTSTTVPFCPAGGDVDISVSIHTTPKGTGAWWVDGTVTITNGSGAAFGSVGWVYLTGATVPGSRKPFFLGWSDPNNYGPLPYMFGQVWVGPHATDTFSITQTVWVDANGANAIASTAPTTVLNAKIVGGWGHPQDSCPGLNLVTAFPLTGQVPNPSDYPPITTTTTTVP